MKFWPLPHARLWGALVLGIALTGCANMQSHDKLASEMQTAGQTNGIPAALARLEASATTADEKAALLYNLERGELLRMDRRYDDSTGAFLLADTKVKEWEETADEVGHVYYLRSHLGPVRLFLARLLLPIIARVMMADLPEGARLFGWEVLYRRILDRDVAKVAPGVAAALGLGR